MAQTSGVTGRNRKDPARETIQQQAIEMRNLRAEVVELKAQQQTFDILEAANKSYLLTIKALQVEVDDLRERNHFLQRTIETINRLAGGRHV